MQSVSQSLFCQAWSGCANTCSYSSSLCLQGPASWKTAGEWYHDTFTCAGRGVLRGPREVKVSNAALEGSRVFSRALCRARQALKPSCLSWNSRIWLHNQQLCSIRGSARWKTLNCFAFRFVLKVLTRSLCT